MATVTSVRPPARFGEMIFDKEKLLSVYDQTKDAEPMISVTGKPHVKPAPGKAPQ